MGTILELSEQYKTLEVDRKLGGRLGQIEDVALFEVRGKDTRIVKAKVELNGDKRVRDTLKLLDPNQKMLEIGVHYERIGSLAMAWRDGCTVQILQHGRFFIAASVLTAGSNDPYGVLGVYLSSNDQHRMARFVELTSVTQQFDGNVVLIGDFNTIFNQLEKAGGGAKSSSSIETFNRFIDDNFLIDINMVGRPFTWSNRRSDDELIQERLDRFLYELEELRLAGIHGGDIISEIEDKLEKALQNEESYWKDKSRVKWLKSGDQNTTFFHQKFRNRTRRNKIWQLTGSDGEVATSNAGITSVAESYFKNIFSSTFHENPKPLFTYFEPKVTSHMNRRLQRPVTMEEVKRATFSIHPQSAPGDDGIIAKFFQSFWNIFSGDVFRAVKSFFSGGKNFEGF
ncbi:uncharacterized protein LOC130974627 [Arachis stenosperma]|uniref:uncharacterized protein LOC130974627 n=1 Tax=Arachis stenosperma TaxID=217475 RepID=UPI0025AC0490|nr:uncharacterized protein LOC130974627 [Arachis stenosperma]